MTTATVRQVQHRVSLDLATPQHITDVLGRTRLVHAVRIEYGRSAIADRVDIVAEFADSTELLPPVTEIPGWLQDLVDQYRPDGPACMLR